MPLSAIVPLLAPTQKAAAVAILNLGAGLTNAVGPVMARVFPGPLGVAGLMWLPAAVYAAGVGLTLLLREGREEGGRRSRKLSPGESARHDGEPMLT